MKASATLSPSDSVETDKIGETALVGNGDFLLEVFGGELVGAHPLLVSFEGNPANVPAKVWFGRPWQSTPEASVCLPASANNYFSLAIIRPDEAGQFRRQKARFQALCAVMLDDVGTKVILERLTLPSSWLLETSPGNHQAGYLLGEPLEDGRVADRLMNAIVAAGLCDPGANGPRARLARLPVAVNGEHTPPFQCRMVEWTPALRYSVEDLVDGLQLEWASAARPTRRSTRAAQQRPSDGDPVWIPRPAENCVLTALRDRSFPSDTDLAAALSAMLTAAVRPSLDHAPMFHTRAHIVGSGKSYLCELVTAFATPQRGSPTTFPSDNEECR